MKKCFKTITKYGLCFTAAILVFVLLLAASACVPQEAVAKHVNASLPGLANEGTYPVLKPGVDATKLDNFTDSVIIAETLATNRDDMSTIISNPLFLYKGDPLESLLYYAENPDLEPDGYYVRYWLGFRATLRPLFAVFNYSQIRHLNFAFLAALALLVTLLIAKRVNVITAVLFMGSLMFIRPLVVGRSFQFSTCFIVALAAMLYMPVLHDKKRSVGICFMLIGMVTQYFDFLTTPIITYSLPMIFLMAIKAHNDEKEDVISLLAASIMWCVGYLGSWLVKLALVNVFTAVDGINNGIVEFTAWVDIGGETIRNGIIEIYITMIKILCPDVLTTIAVMVFFGLTAAIVFVKYRAGKFSVSRFRGEYILLFAAVLPLMWFAAASGHTVQHGFFTFRSFAAVLWGTSALFTSACE